MNRILQVSIDIAPTFLALAGAEVPASMQGVSFLPQVDDAEARSATTSSRNGTGRWSTGMSARYGTENGAITETPRRS